MCGIAGYSGNLPPSVLEAANRAQIHRGPDDFGAYSGPGIGLGHVRLSIIDPSPLGHQPMLSADGNAVICYNGEIYNFHELRADLLAKGYAFKSDSDTETLLYMYLEYGADMLPMLNGIFALAVWDVRDQSLFLARDGFGVKPLYFNQGNGAFVFASEIKALVELQSGDGEINAEAIDKYLTFLWCPGVETPLKAVEALGPGEAMRVRAGKIEHQWQWYQLPASRIENVSKTINVATAIDGTRRLLRQAVHRQMLADVPLGAFLSGGLDSSAVVAFAKQVDPHLKCFTINMQGGDDAGMEDDLPYARQVARHLDVDLQVVDVDAAKMALDIEHMVGQLDEPLADPAALNVLYICQRARECGIKVLLSGTAGDDLFTGYRRHHALDLEKYWGWLPSVVRGGLEQASDHLNTSVPILRRIAKMFSGAGKAPDQRLINYFRWTKRSDLRALYTPSFRAELSHADAEAPMRAYLATLPQGLEPLDQMLALEQRFFLTDHNLIYTDKMSMAAGVEVRVPFLDNDLVAFAAQIPVQFKQRGAVGKWVLKKAMEPYLPHNVIYRPKTGFGVPLRRWMTHELEPLLAEYLSASSLSKYGIFDAEAIEKLVQANKAGQIDASYTLLSIVCIEIWMRRFLGTQAAPA